MSFVTLSGPPRCRQSCYEPREGRAIPHRMKGFFAFKSMRHNSTKSAEMDRKVSLNEYSRKQHCESIPSRQKPEVVGKSEVQEGNWFEVLPVSAVRLAVRKDSIHARDAPIRWQYSSTVSNNRSDEILETPIFPRPESLSACNIVLKIPELVENILQILESSLIHTGVLAQSRGEENNVLTANEKPANLNMGSLSTVLTVNWTFYWAARRILSTRVELRSIQQVEQYGVSSAGKDNLCRDLLVYRVKSCEQQQFDRIQQIRLKSLELHVCPKLVPSERLLTTGTLLKIALPGCGLVDDTLMQLIASHCKSLLILDLRACELVTDCGITAIAENCPKLSYLNVGRVKNSSSITDISLIRICEKTSVQTLGLAGCSIADDGVAAIAKYKGSQIERLSMNQCHSVTDHSLKTLLRLSPKLQVLEIVGCEHIADAEILCRFKIASGALVETSAQMVLQMQLYERQIRA